MINQIKLANLKEAFSIFVEVKKHMIQHGIDQWDDVYPDIDIVRADILNQQAFGYFKDSQLMGYITINEHFDKEYNEVDWKYTDDKPLIVHRLAVNPKFQGLGIAKELMQFAEKEAKARGYLTIRLDAFSENPIALKFYHGLGYCLAGEVTFRKGIFHCFEKRIL